MTSRAVPSATNRREADPVELDDQRLGDPVRAGGKANRAGLGVDHLLDRGCVVGLAVACGPKIEDGQKAAPLFRGLANDDLSALLGNCQERPPEPRKLPQFPANLLRDSASSSILPTFFFGLALRGARKVCLKYAD